MQCIPDFGLLYIALSSAKLRGAVIKIVSFWREMDVKLRSDRLFDLSLQTLHQKADCN